MAANHISSPSSSDLYSNEVLSEDTVWTGEDTVWTSEAFKDTVSVSTQTTISTMGMECPECKQLFVSLKGMHQHLAKTHTQLVRTASCPVCSKMFRHKYAVNFHVKQVHIKTTRVMCPCCSKLIYNKYMLIKHMRNYH
jgi:uncharacterized C2H2 Zn-finger protein